MNSSRGFIVLNFLVKSEEISRVYVSRALEQGVGDRVRCLWGFKPQLIEDTVKDSGVLNPIAPGAGCSPDPTPRSVCAAPP